MYNSNVVDTQWTYDTQTSKIILLLNLPSSNVISNFEKIALWLVGFV